MPAYNIELESCLAKHLTVVRHARQTLPGTEYTWCRRFWGSYVVNRDTRVNICPPLLLAAPSDTTV